MRHQERGHSRGSLRLILAGVLASLPASGDAGQWDYGYGFIGEHISNIRRTATAAENEWIHAIGAGVAYAEQDDDLNAQVTAQVQLRDYKHETFADETLFFLDSAAIWTLLPRRLTWVVEDVFRQVMLDPTAASTPANRAGANVLNTGPDAYLHFGARNTLSLGARYGNVYVDDNNIDNNRYTGIARWMYQASSVSVWSLNYEHLNVRFDDDAANENFQRGDAYVRYELRHTPSLFRLDIGVTTIDRDRSPDVDGSLTRLTWVRDISSQSNIEVALSGSYQDVGSELLASVTDPTLPGTTRGSPIGTDIVTNDVYYTREALVSYTRRGSHVGWTVSGVARDIDFEQTTQDREEVGGRTGISYFFSPLTTFTVFGDYLKVEYVQITREDRDRASGATFVYRLSPNTSIGVELRRDERSSTTTTAEFVDRRVLLSLAYSSGPLFTPLGRR